MSLVTVPELPVTVVDAARTIRQKIGNATDLADVRLAQIRELVAEYGRAAIAAELGSDAAAMLTVYTKLKEAIEIAKETTVEDLP